MAKFRGGLSGSGALGGMGLPPGGRNQLLRRLEYRGAGDSLQEAGAHGADDLDSLPEGRHARARENHDGVPALVEVESVAAPDRERLPDTPAHRHHPAIEPQGFAPDPADRDAFVGPRPEAPDPESQQDCPSKS